MQALSRESGLESIFADERLRQVLDAAPDAMLVIDAEMRIRFANARTEELFGFPRSALLGQPLELLIPPRLRGEHAVHVREYFRSPSVRAMGSGMELLGQHADGHEVPVEVSLSPLTLDGELVVMGSIRDVSARRQLEAAWKVMAARLTSAIESTQDAVALFDQDRRLVLCNDAYRRLFASCVPSSEMMGRRFSELLDAWAPELEFETPEARATFLERALIPSGEPDMEHDVRTRDGRTLRITDRRAPDGGFVSTVWDLTEDARSAEELRQARAVAESANEAKSQFLSSMSHELRTPLNAILGFAQLLHLDKRQPLDAKHRARVAQILDSGEHLLRLIDDVLDLSRIEAGGVVISTEPVDALDVLQQVRTTLEPAARKISVELVAAAAEMPMILADRTRFAQILLNFGSNGVKYNRDGGRLTFTVQVPQPDRLRVTVSDTGIGIPDDKQAGIFQPFQRAGQENGSIQGTGIGLTITKRLAELMGGSVGFRSIHGEGSDFWVDMPVHMSRRRSITPPGIRIIDQPRAHFFY